MAELAVPILVFNMGAEMLYILAHRLQAQQISTDKQKRVVHETIGCLLQDEFVEELFKAAPVYTDESVRELFTRAAHSSIMRLNPLSMGKLYDLMLMGFKYQLLAAAYSHELIDITINHLTGVNNLVTDSNLQTKLMKLMLRVERNYGSLSVPDMDAVRLTLLKFIGTRSVKVSLFLDMGIQRQDGSFVVRGSSTQPDFSDGVYKVTPLDRRTTLGNNLYLGKIPALKKAEVEDSIVNPTLSVSYPAEDKRDAQKANGQRARAELDSLSRLLKPVVATSTSSQETVHITDLFSNWFADAESSSASSQPLTPTSVLAVDPALANQNLVSLAEQLSIDHGAQDGENDLLDLMDS